MKKKYFGIFGLAVVAFLASCQTNVISNCEALLESAVPHVRDDSDSVRELPERFLSVSFVDESLGWAVSSRSLSKTVDAGVHWEKSFTFEDEVSGSIRFAPNLIKIETPSHDKILILSGRDGLVEFTENTGTVNLLFPSTNGLVRGFNFVDVNHGWVVGQTNPKMGGAWDAMAYKTSDGGKTWGLVRFDPLRNCNCSFYDVLLLNITTGFIVGDIIATTSNGGERIRIVERDATLHRKIFGTAFKIRSWEGRLFAIIPSNGNKFLISEDKGNTWESRSVLTAQDINDVIFVDKNRMIALADGAIWQSNDSGRKWEKKQSLNSDGLAIYQIPGTDRYYLVGKEFKQIFPI